MSRTVEFHHDSGVSSRTERSRARRRGRQKRNDPNRRTGRPVASKQHDIRPKITLACVDCKDRNYITKKNRRNDPDRLELAKFCPKCRQHTAHRETR